VAVEAVNDSVVDGIQKYTIVTGAASSADSSYNGMDPPNVPVVGLDDDVSGIMVFPTSGLSTSEAGGTASFTVVLNTQPLANVMIGISSSNTAEGTVSPSSLTFSPAGPAGWNIAQTVTVTGVDDLANDGDVAFTIVTSPATGDPAYVGLDAANVSVVNVDNDGSSGTTTTTSTTTTMTRRLRCRPYGAAVRTSASS
jgi:hypothetical protein